MMADDLHKEAMEDFDRISEADNHNRETGLEDLVFAREGKHWPDDVAKERLDEGRPVITVNLLPAFLRQVINDARQAKPSIKVMPVDDKADPETAELLGDLIRGIEYNSDADVAYDTGIECAASNGFGYWRVTADYAHDDSFDMDLKIVRVRNPFSVYGDPDSQAADSSDWNTAFVTDHMSRAKFERQWKGKFSASFDDDSAWSGASWRDADGLTVGEWWRRDEVERPILLVGPARVPGADPAEPPLVIGKAEFEASEEWQALVAAGSFEVYRERVAKSWEVKQHFLTGAEVLETRDWPGRFIPIIPVYGDEFDIKGKVFRRSLIHDALDPSRLHDYWMTNATELVALAPRTPYIGPTDAFNVDTEMWATVNRKSHPFLRYGGQIAPQRQPLDVGTAVGSIQQALSAHDTIKAVTGLHDASLGARSNEISGRAILARQREGDVSSFHFSDNQVRGIRHTGRVLIDLLPHFYDTARVVRVRGEDGTERSVPINRPFPKTNPETGAPVMEQAVGADGEPMQRPAMAMHDLTVGKYDVTVSSGPSYTTRRQEAAAEMMELVRVYPQVAPLIGDLLAKKLDWPGADEIAERLKRMVPAQALGEDGGLPPQLKEFIQKGQQMIEALTKEVEGLKADKSIDLMKAKTGQFEAETDRMKVAADIARPTASVPPAFVG
jgi:hypothetical protein